MKKILSLILLMVLLAGAVWAGDLATFINLGFSENSRFFMFGQYGIEGKSSLPYAEVYTVDVHENKFTPRGVKNEVYNIPPQAGQNGMGALLKILHDLAARENDPVSQYQINHMKSGRLVYLLVNGQTPKEQIDFRDFGLGNSYRVILNQSRFGTGKGVSSAFHINLTVTDKAGNVTPFIIGLPNYRRTGVQAYRLKQVIFSPDESSLIFVVEKEMVSTDGVDFRYMVETVRLK